MKTNKKETLKRQNKIQSGEKTHTVYTKENIVDEKKRKRWIYFLLGMSFTLIPVWLMNKKYGKAAADYIQDNLEKSRKNNNNFEYFDRLQNVWKRLNPKFKSIDTNLVKKDYKKITLKTDDNIDLNCFIYSKNNPDGKWMIILHGWTENKYAVMNLVDMYLKLNYNVLVYDQRGHGDSTKINTTMGFLEKNDLDFIIDYLIANYDVDEINFHGRSMGAITILNYLTIYQSKAKNKLFNRAILNGCTGDMKRQMYAFYKDYFQLPVCFFRHGLNHYLKNECGYTPNKIHPIARIKRTYRWPFLLIHSQNDEMVNPAASIDILNEKIKCEKEVKTEVYMPDKGEHVMEYVYDQETFIEKIKTFLTKP